MHSTLSILDLKARCKTNLDLLQWQVIAKLFRLASARFPLRELRCRGVKRLSLHQLGHHRLVGKGESSVQFRILFHRRGFSKVLDIPLGKLPSEVKHSINDCLKSVRVLRVLANGRFFTSFECASSLKFILVLGVEPREKHAIEAKVMCQSGKALRDAERVQLPASLGKVTVAEADFVPQEPVPGHEVVKNIVSVSHGFVWRGQAAVQNLPLAILD